MVATPLFSSTIGDVPVNNGVIGPAVRHLALTDALTDSGIGLAASATSTNFGVSRTAGTSLVLVGNTASAGASTQKAIWEIMIPPTYQAGSAFSVVINANYTGAGTVTGASTTIALAAYTEANGVETAITGITSAQQFTGTATDYTFTIPAGATNTLIASGRLVLEVTMLVTTSASTATGQINKIDVMM